MFTGIVRERAKVASFDRGRLVVESSLEPGDEVNLEVDVLAKYVERLAVR